MPLTNELNIQCHHADKYEISTDGEPVPELPYPSRLGSLQTTQFGTTIRCIDLNKKLCRACCDLLIGDGKYLVWSVLAGTSAANVTAALEKLIPSAGQLPPILQAGSELKDTLHNAVFPIPDIPGAKEAWQWLETEAKLFYIDQLHMSVGRGMSPLSRKRAAKDSAVALRYGQVFNRDVLRSPSTMSDVKSDQGPQDTKDPAVVVKKKKASKKSSTKMSDENKSDEKIKKKKKEKQAAGTTELVTSQEDSTQAQPSMPSTVAPKPASGGSSVCAKSSNTVTTTNIVILGTKPGPMSTPNMPIASMPRKSELNEAAIASTSLTDANGVNSNVNSKPTMMITGKTLSRSWGWSEPFEFTTGPRKVPALSDYERVAESRAPSQSMAKSLDNYLENHLKLDKTRKLLGPGDSKSTPRTVSGLAPSSSTEHSTALQLSQPKRSASKAHDNDSSTKKSSKDSNAKSKPKKIIGDHLYSSEVAKPARSQTTAHKENTESITCKKNQSALANSSKSSQVKTSHGSKQQVHQDASSTSNHRADKEAVSSDISANRSGAVIGTQEVHEKSKDVKSTSNGHGSSTGLGKAGLTHFEHKSNEAVEKRQKKTKAETKPSKPKAKSQGKAHGGSHDHSEDSDAEPMSHSGSQPLHSGNKPRGLPEHGSLDHPKGNDPKPSVNTRANTQQPEGAKSSAMEGEHPVQNGTGKERGIPSKQRAASSQELTKSLGEVSPRKRSAKLPDTSGGGRSARNAPAEGKPLPNHSGTHALSERPSGVDKVRRKPSAGSTQKPMQASHSTSVAPRPRHSDTAAKSGSSVHQTTGNQVPPEPKKSTAALRSLNPKAAKKPEGVKKPSKQDPVKSSRKGPAGDERRSDHMVAHNPKRNHSTRRGGDIAHKTPGDKPHTHQSKLKQKDTLKLPNAVSDHKRRSGFVLVAGDSGSDDESNSDSDNEPTHADGSDDDHENDSESDDGTKSASDENNSSQDESTTEQGQSEDSEDSSDDDVPGDDNQDSSANESDGDDGQEAGSFDSGSGDESDGDNEQEAGLSDSGSGDESDGGDEQEAGSSDSESGDENEPEPADHSEGEMSDDEDGDENTEGGTDSSGSDDSGKESGSEQEGPGTSHSESEASDDGAGDNSNDGTDQEDLTDQDPTDQDDANDEDPIADSPQHEDSENEQDSDEEEDGEGDESEYQVSDED